MAIEFFFKADNLLIWRPGGVLNNDKIIRYIAFLEAAEAGRQSPFDRFNDLSRTTGVSISYNEVSEYAVRRRSYASSFLDRPVKAAFHALNPVSYGMARMYQNLLDCAKMEVRVYQSLDEAAAWLGVDIALLADDPHEGEE